MNSKYSKYQINIKGIKLNAVLNNFLSTFKTWFEYFIKGITNNLETEPPVDQYWVVYHALERVYLTIFAGQFSQIYLSG